MVFLSARFSTDGPYKEPDALAGSSVTGPADINAQGF